MPDLLTHSVSGYLLGWKLPPRWPTVLVVGAVLPDALAYGPSRLLAALLGIPIWSQDAFHLFHAPLPYLVFCWAVALLVPSGVRGRFLGCLLAGGFLHISLDLLQRHVVPAAYFPLYPFVRSPWELGWISTEASLWALPLTVTAGLVVLVRRRRWAKAAAPGQ